MNAVAKLCHDLGAVPAEQRLDLLPAPVAAAVTALPSAQVVEIPPELADTAALCQAYDLPAASGANCVIVAGKRGEAISYVGGVVLATHRLDVNGLIRRKMNARKASFAPMDDAVTLTGMEYGGITPVGLPADWPLWLDANVPDAGTVVIGSGVRRSKLIVAASELANLPNSEVVTDLAKPA